MTHRTADEQEEYEDEHKHYSDRGQWLRAGVLGANDGLVSVTATMLGVSGGSPEIRTLILAGSSALVAGQLNAFATDIGVAIMQKFADSLHVHVSSWVIL